MASVLLTDMPDRLLTHVLFLEPFAVLSAFEKQFTLIKI